MAKQSMKESAVEAGIDLAQAIDEAVEAQRRESDAKAVYKQKRIVVVTALQQMAADGRYEYGDVEVGSLGEVLLDYPNNGEIDPEQLFAAVPRETFFRMVKVQLGVAESDPDWGEVAKSLKVQKVAVEPVLRVAKLGSLSKKHG